MLFSKVLLAVAISSVVEVAIAQVLDEDLIQIASQSDGQVKNTQAKAAT